MAPSEWQEQSLHPYCVGSISSTISTSFHMVCSIFRFHSREFLSLSLYLPLSCFPSVFPLSFFVSIYFMLIFTLKFIDYEYVKCINTLEWIYPIPIWYERERGRGWHSFRLKTIENIRFSVSAFIRASEWVNFFLKLIIEVHLQTLSVCVCTREWVCRWYIWDLSMKWSKIVDVSL